MSITVFGREGCAPCKTLKYWLGKKELPYQELPIDDHRDELARLGFVAAPVIKVNDRYFNNLPSLASYLNGIISN